MRDLFLRERAVAGTRHRRRGVHFLNARQRIRADQLTLAIEVGCNHDGVCFFRQVLQAADDFLFFRQLLDGRVHQVRQRIHLPCLQFHAVFGERLFLFERRTRQACRQLGRNRFAVGRDAAPAAALLIYERRRKIGLQDMAAQADGHPFLAVDFKAVHGRGIHLVRLRFLRAQQRSDLRCGVVLLGYHQLHVASLLVFRAVPATSLTRLPHSFIYVCGDFRALLHHA